MLKMLSVKWLVVLTNRHVSAAYDKLNVNGLPGQKPPNSQSSMGLVGKTLRKKESFASLAALKSCPALTKPPRSDTTVIRLHLVNTSSKMKLATKLIPQTKHHQTVAPSPCSLHSSIERKARVS